MWGMLFRIVVALALAFFVSAFVGERLSVSSETFLEPGILARIAERGWNQLMLAWPFVLFAVALAEAFKIRSLIYYLAAGAIAAVAAVSFDQGAWDFDLVSSWLPRWRDGVLTSGVLGGLTYWMAHGYKAGWPVPDRETVSREPMAALVGKPSDGRGWLAAALGLAAVAGLGWWTLDEDRFNDKPARMAESEVSAALSAGGYPWARLKISEDVGQVVGLAPDEQARTAAFRKAQQITEPMIGAAGVMTGLENRLTAPDPVAIAAAQAAARRTAAEAEAAKSKEDEDAKRAAEAKRRLDEQAKRVAAAEIEAKRKADEARRTAAEAEARRKAEEETKRTAAEAEAKRVAAELEARRVAAEAEAKRKAEEETRRIAVEADAAKRKAEEDARRLAAETEAKRKADEEARRLVAAVQAKKAEEDTKRKLAEAESVKRKTDEAEKRAAAEAKRATDDAAKRLAAAMADKKADIAGKIAAVPAGPPVPRAPQLAAPASPLPAAGGTATCAAEPLGVIRGTRIALKRSDVVLPPESIAQLDRLAEALKSCGNVNVRVSGFSTRGFDTRAKIDHSRLLAARVADELGRRGIARTRLQTAGLGLAGGEAASGLPGRRVELAVLEAAAQPVPAPSAAASESCTSDPAALRLKFGSARDQPAGSYRAEVDRIARILLACGDAKLVVEGHTDATGSDGFNKRLSERRAELVKRALVRRGVSESRLSVTGFGSAKPLDPSGTPAAKAANRRVDIVFASGPPATAAPAAPAAKK